MAIWANIPDRKKRPFNDSTLPFTIEHARPAAASSSPDTIMARTRREKVLHSFL